jgi:hypothetical protein
MEGDPRRAFRPTIVSLIICARTDKPDVIALSAAKISLSISNPSCQNFIARGSEPGWGSLSGNATSREKSMSQPHTLKSAPLDGRPTTSQYPIAGLGIGFGSLIGSQCEPLNSHTTTFVPFPALQSVVFAPSPMIRIEPARSPLWREETGFAASTCAARPIHSTGMANSIFKFDQCNIPPHRSGSAPIVD